MNGNNDTRVIYLETFFIISFVETVTNGERGGENVTKKGNVYRQTCNDIFKKDNDHAVNRDVYFLFDNILICTLIKVHIILIITRINYNKIATVANMVASQRY